MRILHINSMISGSTGQIMRDLAQFCSKDEVYVSYPAFDGIIRGVPRSLVIGNRVDTFIHHCLGRLTGLNGRFSYFTTKKFLSHITKIHPDIIHLHNLHNCYINLGLLFDYIKKNKIAVIWTLHDCWAFTGQCAYFDMFGCEKWRSECDNCQQLFRYPKSWVDHTKQMYRYKKKKFIGIDNLVVVTPSLWLAGLVKDSYLGTYPIKVINNGVDLNIFRPMTNKWSRYKTNGKFLILAVAFKWDKRKGFDILVEVSKKMDKKNYQMIVVGVSAKQKLELDKNVICIGKTNNREELANIYSTADVFINPTREENFCMVNIEALACGTPVITFRSGGASEAIDDTCGIILEEKNSMAILRAINDVRKKDYKILDCVRQANKFEKNKVYNEYVNLYKEILERNSHDCVGVT